MRSVSLKATAALAILALTASLAVAQDKTMTYAGSGGVVKETSEKVFVAAFEKETGWDHNWVTAESELLPQLEAMHKTGKMLWDTMELSGLDYPTAVNRGLLEKIDYSVVDPDGKLPEDAKQEYGVVYSSYSDVLVQRLDKNPPGKKMTSWADFWDLKTFPGPRSLYKSPVYNLEFALLADGVAKDKLYEVLGSEEGVERAFAKLDEIKSSIPVWWESGAQSVQLLSDGEVFYSTTYNGRVKKLEESGIPAEIVWNGGALHLSLIGIAKGAPNMKAAIDWVRFRTTRADLEVEYVKQLPYPNFAPGLFEQMDPALAKTMPTYPDNAAMQFEPDEQFWADHLTDLQERFDEWILK